MPLTRRNLGKKRDALAASAKTATALAENERQLADQQHLVAHRLEGLADKLQEEVAAIEAEIHDAPVTPSGAH